MQYLDTNEKREAHAILSLFAAMQSIVHVNLSWPSHGLSLRAPRRSTTMAIQR